MDQKFRSPLSCRLPPGFLGLLRLCCLCLATGLALGPEALALGGDGEAIQLFELPEDDELERGELSPETPLGEEEQVGEDPVDGELLSDGLPAEDVLEQVPAGEASLGGLGAELDGEEGSQPSVDSEGVVLRTEEKSHPESLDAPPPADETAPLSLPDSVLESSLADSGAKGSAPFYKQWWFYAGSGAIVAAGVTTALLVVLLPEAEPVYRNTLDVSVTR